MVAQKILSDSSHKEVVQICRENDISTLEVFGSYARGESSPESDIDLLAHFSKQKSLLDLVRLERLLSAVLHNKVDLLTEGSLSPYLRDRVKLEAKMVYCETQG